MGDFLNLGTPALWALAVGFFSPPAISIIQQSRWSERRQALVAFGFYLVVAAVTAYVLGLFNTPDILRLALIIFLAAGTSYKTLWKPTGISPAIEAATLVGPDSGPKHSAGSQPLTINIHSTADPQAVADEVARNINQLNT